MQRGAQRPVGRNHGQAQHHRLVHWPTVGKPQNARHRPQQGYKLQATKPLHGTADRRVEQVHLGHVKVGLGKAQRHIGRAPARRLDPDPQLVAPVLGMPAVVQQHRIHLGVGPQRVPAVERAACAVHARLLLVFEGAKQAVPQHQNAAVVFVQVGVVHGMVHAVVGGGAKHPVKPAQFADLLGMHPKLVEQVDQRDDAKNHRRHARHRHGQVKHPAQQHATAGLAQRGGQVVLLTLVVHHVRRPEHGTAVAGAVHPVVAKVVKHQGQQHAVPGAPEGGVREQGHAAEYSAINAHSHQFAEHPAQLAQHAQADAVDAVV